jgi:SAM-dependent methyltransferase
MRGAKEVKRVLILGGGDGLAAREVLRFPEVESVTLVDLDPAMTKLAVNFEELAALNRHSLENPKLHVINDDALRFLDETKELFDVAIIDFPDPNNFSLGKLYTTKFYSMVKRHLSEGGGFVFRFGDGVVGVGRSVTVGRKAAWGAKTPWKLKRPCPWGSTRSGRRRGGAVWTRQQAPCCHTGTVARGPACRCRGRRCRRGGRSPSPPRRVGAWVTEGGPAPAAPAGPRAERPRTRLAATGPRRRRSPCARRAAPA